MLESILKWFRRPDPWRTEGTPVRSLDLYRQQRGWEVTGKIYHVDDAEWLFVKWNDTNRVEYVNREWVELDVQD